MTENFYEYEIEYFNPDEKTTETFCGIIFAESYGAAAAKLEEYYGDEIVSINYLMATGDDTVYEFNDDMSSNLKDYLLALFNKLD